MSLAWETTVEDVENVLRAHGLDESQAEALLERLDVHICEQAALRGDTIEEQTNYSYQEIERQLKGINIIPSDAKTQFPTDEKYQFYSQG